MGFIVDFFTHFRLIRLFAMRMNEIDMNSGIPLPKCCSNRLQWDIIRINSFHLAFAWCEALYGSQSPPPPPLRLFWPFRSIRLCPAIAMLANCVVMSEYVTIATKFIQIENWRTDPTKYIVELILFRHERQWSECDVERFCSVLFAKFWRSKYNAYIEKCPNYTSARARAYASDCIWMAGSLQSRSWLSISFYQLIYAFNAKHRPYLLAIELGLVKAHTHTHSTCT